MKTAELPRNPVTMPDNALAQKAPETIEQIDREAKEKKAAQLEALQSAKAAIHERMPALSKANP